MVVFATSVFLLLAFIYWRTAGFMTAQTDETIEAEIAGLAEQYRGRGVNGPGIRPLTTHAERAPGTVRMTVADSAGTVDFQGPA